MRSARTSKIPKLLSTERKLSVIVHIVVAFLTPGFPVTFFSGLSALSGLSQTGPLGYLVANVGDNDIEHHGMLSLVEECYGLLAVFRLNDIVPQFFQRDSNHFSNALFIHYQNSFLAGLSEKHACSSLNSVM